MDNPIEDEHIDPSISLGTIADYTQILDNFSGATRNYIKGHVQNIMIYLLTTLVSLSLYLAFVILPQFTYPLHCILAFAVWIIFYILKFIFTFKEFSHSISNDRRFHLVKSMVSCVLIIMGIILMELKCFGVKFCTAYVISSPLLISLLLSLVLFKDARNHCLGISVALKNLISFFRLILTFMILIRIEDTITDRWFLTLWYSTFDS